MKQRAPTNLNLSFFTLAFLLVFAGVASASGQGGQTGLPEENSSTFPGSLSTPGLVSSAESSGTMTTSIIPSCCQASESEKKMASGTEPEVDPGIDEHLGTVLPLDLDFTDETGVTRPLKNWITNPTMIAFVFYRCPLMCNLIQGSVADVVKKIQMKPGEDYNVLSISIDEEDNPATAKDKKHEFFNVLPSAFPDSAWKFLSGTKENIHKVTKAAGFFFARIKGSIVHPAALIFVSPEGKMVRYLHGTEYLPFNVSIALTEAAEGRVGYAIKSVVTFCFSYDPAGKKYVLNIVRITGLIILLFVGIFLFFLLRKGEINEKQIKKQ